MTTFPSENWVAAAFALACAALVCGRLVRSVRTGSARIGRSAISYEADRAKFVTILIAMSALAGLLAWITVDLIFGITR